MLRGINNSNIDIFNRIIKSSPGILFHLEVDLQKKEEHYLFISENYADLFDVEIEYTKTHKLLQTTLTPESLEIFKRDFYKIVSTQSSVEMEIEIHTPKGNMKWIKVKATIERQGDISNLFGIYIDITDEKEKHIKQEKITNALLNLNNDHSIHSGNITEASKTITQALSETLNIGRVSIWTYNEDKSAILCEQLYETETATFSHGVTLFKKDFAPYFTYLEKDPIIKAFDAEQHEATACFTEAYLRPLNIKTIVDVPIYHNDKIIGVLCSENIGNIRTFESNEIQFMVNVAEIYSYTFSLSEQNNYKRQLEYINKNLNKLVEKRTVELEIKNKEIIDSINYARRIQNVILPSEEMLTKHTIEHFIIYQPKDIVSGDFYWFASKNDKLIIACSDCTGHGVPGSLVSLICYNELSRVVNEFNLTDPGLILDKCRELISEVFNTGNDQIRDGMDISIITIDLKNKQFQWAGANNPLWFIQNGKLEVLKGNKQHIGFCENPVPFKTHTVSLHNNETFYMFTDGYSDQFGGEAGKKYKTAAFKSLIESIHHLPLQKQKTMLNESFYAWKGELEQVDDVSIIGFRI